MNVGKRKQRFSVDPKSYDLAEHFLSDLEGDEASEDQKRELAQVIQDAIEVWFEQGRIGEEMAKQEVGYFFTNHPDVEI